MSNNYKSQNNKRKGNTNNRPNKGQRTTQIFVGGCHPQIKNQELKNYFGQFGKVVETRLVRDKRTKKFRGFGFVTFASFETVEDVLENKYHIIKGKKAELKKAFSKEQTREKLLDEKQRKLYITGIAKNLKRKDLNDYFKRFGDIEDTRIIHDPTKNKDKGFGFVLFSDYDSLDRALSRGLYHVVKDCKLECKKTRLREENNEHGSQDGYNWKGGSNQEGSSKNSWSRGDIRKISNHGKSGGYFSHEDDYEHSEGYSDDYDQFQEKEEYVNADFDSEKKSLKDRIIPKSKQGNQIYEKRRETRSQRSGKGGSARGNEEWNNNNNEYGNSNDNKNNEFNSNYKSKRRRGSGLEKHKSSNLDDEAFVSNRKKSIQKQRSYNYDLERQNFYQEKQSKFRENENFEEQAQNLYNNNNFDIPEPIQSEINSKFKFPEYQHPKQINNLVNEFLQGNFENKRRVKEETSQQNYQNFEYNNHPHPRFSNHQNFDYNKGQANNSKMDIYQDFSHYDYQQGNNFYNQNQRQEYKDTPYNHQNELYHQNYSQPQEHNNYPFNPHSLPPRPNTHQNYPQQNPYNPDNNSYYPYSQNYGQNNNNFSQNFDNNNTYFYGIGNQNSNNNKDITNNQSGSNSFRSNMFGGQPLSYSKNNSSGDSSNGNFINQKLKNNNFKSLNPSPFQSDQNSGPKTSNSSLGAQNSPYRKDILTPSIDQNKRQLSIFEKMAASRVQEEEEEEADEEEEFRRRNMVLIHQDDLENELGEEDLDNIGIEVLDGGDQLNENLSCQTPIGFQMKRNIPLNTMSEKFSKTGSKEKKSGDSIHSENFKIQSQIRRNTEEETPRSTKAIIGNHEENHKGNYKDKEEKINMIAKKLNSKQKVNLKEIFNLIGSSFKKRE